MTVAQLSSSGMLRRSRLGIGTTNPDAKLRITGAYENLFIAAGTNGVLTVSNPSENLMTMFTGTSDALALGTSSTERMRIDASGNLLVGKTAPTISTTGVAVTPFHTVRFVQRQSGNWSLLLNRDHYDGDILRQFRKDGTTVGSIGVLQAVNNVSISGKCLNAYSIQRSVISP